MWKRCAYATLAVQGGIFMMSCGGFGAGCGKGSYKPSVIPTINAGAFREKITIQVSSLVQDNRGGGVKQWSDVATVWAQIKTYSASDHRNREMFQSAQLRAKNEFLITIRYTPDTITTGMRVIWNGFNLEILAITNVDALNWTMELYCRREGNGEPS
ncbi:MAG: hypothetical protein CML24_06685 [Rhizobiales bacterium]|nr:hypothetical protein [Hyphomicrobiales bacterium]